MKRPRHSSPIFSTLAGLILLGALGACREAPELHPDYRQRVYDEPGAVPYPADPGGLVLDRAPIEGLSLETARELALLRNPTVRAQTAAVVAAQASIAEARAAFLPDLSFQIGRTAFDKTRTVSIPGGGSFSLSPEYQTTGQARLGLSLFAFGRDVENLRAAESAVSTQVLDERTARQAILAEVDQAWLGIHEAVEQAAVAADAQANAVRQAEDARQLFAAGRVTKDSALTAEVEEKRRTQETVVANNAIRHARRVLNALLAREADAEIALAAPSAWAGVSIDPEAVRSLATAHNPALLGFRTRQTELDHRRESIIRGALPEVTGEIGVEYTDFTEASGYSTNTTATLGVQWAPVQGGRRLAALDRIHAQLVQLREQELAARSNLEVQVLGLVDDIAEAAAEYRWANSSIGAAEESLRILRDRFQNGRATSQEVLEAQVTATNAKFATNRARFRHEALIARLEAAVGVARASWMGTTNP